MKMRPILSELEEATQEGLRAGGKATLARSNGYAPKDDLDLVKSGRVTIDDLTVQVSYTALHARIEHENLEHQHPNGGQAKFLERASEEIRMEEFIAAKVREQFGG